MNTYLFFPLSTDEAIAISLTKRVSYEEIATSLSNDITIYKELLQSTKYKNFVQKHFPYGLPFCKDAVQLTPSLNLGPNDPQTSLFLDTLDLDNPWSTGASGYGYYSVQVHEGSERVCYRADETVLLAVTIEDDSGRVDTLQCTVSVQLYMQGISMLYKKAAA